MLLNTYVKEPSGGAKACVIWLHGLGANGKDMEGLAHELPMRVPLRHVFMDAPVRPVTLNNHMPMRAWYDITGTTLTDREDSAGIKQSEAMILQVIDKALSEGFLPQHIFLAGFSQGGAMALYTGLGSSLPLGGIVALSSYLPLAASCQIHLPTNTPIFMAAGMYDELVLPLWTKQSAEHIERLGFHNIAYHEYPMEHNICAEEVRDLTNWLTTQVSLNNHQDGAVKQ